MKDAAINAKGSAETTVTEDKLAVSVGSGSLRVFATPAMTALMESAACDCLSPFLEENEATVGTELCIKHSSATPETMKVRAEAVLTAVNGREFTFDVKAFDECGEIGSGTHKRFLVYSEKFTAKTNEKLKNK
ncbi:MAG: thioesterase family protein [Ruminococcus sp.]|nr:thioesterase family protein [Ruminococcus sp.]